MIISYEPKTITAEIEGNEYPVNARTVELDEQLRELDKARSSRSEYEQNTTLIDLILGKGTSKKLFPAGKKENLDKIMYYASQIKEAYYFNYNEMMNAESAKALEPVMEVAEKLAPLTKLNNLKVK